MADWKDKEMPIKKELRAVGQWLKTYWQIMNELNPARMVSNLTTSAVKWLQTPEIRPERTFEETAGWWNYDYNRKVSQADNEQGHYNALHCSRVNKYSTNKIYCS